MRSSARVSTGGSVKVGLAKYAAVRPVIAAAGTALTPDVATPGAYDTATPGPTRACVPSIGLAALSAGPKNRADGSSNSISLLVQFTVLWQELKSDTTKPSKPQAPLRMFVRSSALSHENGPLTRFFAHIMEPDFARLIDASNAG